MKNLLERISPSPITYQIIYQDYANVNFSVAQHVFAEEVLAKAKELWTKAPGKFDGTLMGVTATSQIGKTLLIQIAPMQYSIFRYIAKCCEEGISIDEKDRIFPIGTASVSFITDREGRKQFIMGIREKGSLEEGCLEFVPQGFCDVPTSGSLQNYGQETITRELQEELTEKGKEQSRARFKQIRNLGLALETYSSDYALMFEGEVEDASDSLGNETITTEHQRIILVDENDLEHAIADPTEYLRRRNIDIGKRGIQMQGTSHALMYAHLMKEKKE